MKKPLNRPSQVIVPETHMEHPDPEPVSLPLNARRPDRLQDQIMRLVKQSIDEYAAATGQETFDESEDFDVDDELDPKSPYEEFEDPVTGRMVTAVEFSENAEAYKKRYVKAQMDYWAQMDQNNRIAENLFRHYNRDKPSRAASERVSSKGPQDLPDEEK